MYRAQLDCLLQLTSGPITDKVRLNSIEQADNCIEFLSSTLTYPDSVQWMATDLARDIGKTGDGDLSAELRECEFEFRVFEAHLLKA